MRELFRLRELFRFGVAKEFARGILVLGGLFGGD